LSEIDWVPGGLVSPEFEASFVVVASQDVEGEVVHEGHVGGSVTGPGSRGVFAEGDVEHPMGGSFPVLWRKRHKKK